MDLPDAKLPNIGKLLTKKIGPVPVWLIGVGAIGGLYYYRSRMVEQASAESSPDGTTTGQLTDSQGMPYYDSGLPASSYPTGYPTPGTVPASDFGGGVGGGGGGVDTISCPEGAHWDADMQACVPNTQGTVSCPPGAHWDGVAAACIPDSGGGVKCPPGAHWDDAKQGCVPDTLPKPIHNCPSGTHWDKKKKRCVATNVSNPHPCGANHHWDSKLKKCVPTHQQCGPGMHWDSAKKKCVHNAATAPAQQPRHATGRRSPTPAHPTNPGPAIRVGGAKAIPAKAPAKYVLRGGRWVKVSA